MQQIGVAVGFFFWRSVCNGSGRFNALHKRFRRLVMKTEMTLGLVILTLAFAGCSEGTTGTGSNAGLSQQHVVNRPTDNGSMPSTTSDASGTHANSDRTGSSGTTAAPGSGMHNGSSNAGSDVNGAAPSTYAPGQSGTTTPSGADAGANAGSKAPTETTTPPTGR
jgi:hypothetical protein